MDLPTWNLVWATERLTVSDAAGISSYDHSHVSSRPIAMGGPGLLPSNCRRRLSRLIEAQKSKILARWYECQFDQGRLRRFGIDGAENIERQTLVSFFLRPLFHLLTAYISTGETRFRDVYLDERLRYAPHRADISVRTSFFAEVIPADEDAIFSEIRIDCEPELVSALRIFLTDLHAPLLSSEKADAVRVLALGDCLMNEIRVFLPSRCRAAGISLDVRMLYFSAATGKDLVTEEAIQFLSSNPADLIALSFLTYEGLPPYAVLLREAQRLTPSEIDERTTAIVGLMRRFMSELRERTEAPFILHTASGLPLTRLRHHLPILPAISDSRRRVLAALNNSIRELSENIPNTLLIDEEFAATTTGYRNCMIPVIPKRVAGTSFFHTSRFGERLSELYVDVISSYRDLAKAKVLLVDFDETLWKGIMAEGPVHHLQERQRLLRQLKDGGMLLVAISKNDPSNVRWNEMLLEPSDFASLKINWNPKIESIEQTAQALDLGFESFVFIDDSATERALVRAQFPKIRTLDSTDPATWRSLERLLSFPNTRDTEEARARTTLYRAQAMRKEALAQAVDYPSMMAAIRLEARFGLATAGDLSRIFELIHRTNQFNTTTARYSRARLQEFLHSDRHRIYVSELSDKYSSFGLVAVAIIERRGAEAIFDSFVMSCRAMGFGLERLVLRLVLDAEKNATRFIGRFLPTDRNSPASKLFVEAGFRQLNETESLFEADGSRPDAPSWFTVYDRSGRDFRVRGEAAS